MHVLVIPSWYPTARSPSTGIFFRDQVLALHAAGVRMGVIYPDHRPVRRLLTNARPIRLFQLEEELDDGVPTLRAYGFRASRLRRMSQSLWVWQARRLFDHYRQRHGAPDIVHAHTTLEAGLAAREIRRRAGVPYVITEHSSEFPSEEIPRWRVPAIQDAWSEASAVLAVSSYLAAAMRRYQVPGAPPIGIVPNVVDTEFFTLPPRPRGTDVFRFVTVSNLKPNKGIDLIIRAFSANFGDRDAVHLDVVGDSDHRRELEKLAAAGGADERIHFHGKLDRGGVRDVLWSAHAYVVASHHETFGVAPVEAMATGLPVIATRCGGPEEFVMETTGQLVKTGDPSALGRAMSSFHSQRGQWAGRAEAIRQFADSRFSTRKFVARMQQVYEGVRGGAGSLHG